ncbi:TrbI/VirB10 family protein [uncultured Shewanella sp.]|uniref:TrbI/VirB10 family protein n=1 Tax=uncultured Shewanella sp. TaxID=173975 RepID=UPI00261D72A0|nr:TrbI/VirB10 family protein [uncultured Shewanella sp.]
MSDIPNAYEGNDDLDRADLNIGGRTKKDKKVAFMIFVLVSIAVIFIAIFFVVKAIAGKDESQEQEIASNTAVTSVKVSKTDNNDAFFDAFNAKKEREKKIKADNERKRIEKARLAALAAERANTQIGKNLSTQGTVKDTPPPPTPPVREVSNNRDELTPEQRKMDNTVMLKLGTGNVQLSQQGEADNRYTVAAFANGSAASRGRNGLDFLLMHGSSIPCALYTQIISDYEGFVTCRVIQDVYSANGAALLVERGSLISGRQQVAMEQGKSRLFTTWADIETVNGISIKLDSLGAGRLGAAGSQAWVDHHYMQRFGGAVLLSFLDDAFSAIANHAKNSNSNVTYDNSTDNANDMAALVLEESIKIKPTGYSKIGQRINIIVARDIDFSTVYQFE